MVYLLKQNPNSWSETLKSSTNLKPDLEPSLFNKHFIDAHFRLAKNGKIETVKAGIDVGYLPKEEFCDLLPGLSSNATKSLLQLKNSGTVILERDAQAQASLGVVALEDSSWNVVEVINSPVDGDAANVIYSPIVWIKPNATLKYIRYYLHSTPLQEHETVQVEQNGCIEFFNFRMGQCRNYKTNVHITLVGQESSATIRELNLVKASQVITSNITVEHQARHTNSTVLVKNVIFAKGFSTFDGLVCVHPKAEYSNAEQKNYNLLLDNSGRAVSIPNLDIQNPNVKCTHGTATQHLDDETLFYMNSRGIDKANAQELFLEGFAESIIEYVPLNYREQSRTLFKRCC